MGRCSILGCTNRPEQKNEDITFHRFPKKPRIRNLWILLTGRKNWQPNQSARICSKHFESSCFRKTKNHLTYLNQDSIPTLFIPKNLAGMVNYCVVSGCKREGYPGCGVSFHKIPANEERRDLWIRAMRLKTNVSKSAFICGRHFTDEDYFSLAKCRLKPDAVPSILSPMVVPVIKNVVVGSNTLEVGLSESDNSMTESDTAHEGPSDLSGYHEAVPSSEDLEVLDESPVKKVELVDIGTQTQKIPSPETEKLRRDIKVLRLRLRRYEIKIVNLKTILDVVLKKKKMKIIKS